MKVSILVILVVLPMVVSIGLYCYAFISTRWNSIDNNLISRYDFNNKERKTSQLNNNNTIQLENRRIRHAFRSRYGLFGYCLDYKWLNLLTIKSQNNPPDEFKSNSTSCNQSSVWCQEMNLCVKACENAPNCPSYRDQKECIRDYRQTRYYWKEEKCIWHSLSFDIQGIPRWVSSYLTSSRDSYDIKRIRYYIMLLFFVAAPLLTFLALLILLCINCIDRFYSIPFAFVSCFSLASFLSGVSGLGIYLYEWIQEHFYQLDYTTDLGQIEPSVIALNPWILNVEWFGLAFWIILAAIGTNLFTTILSCCFCCGLQSDKSKLRIYVNNDKYAIVHTNLYDE